MAAPLAFNHVGITVPDIDRAIEWYETVMGFRLIFRRLMQYQPQIPEVREIFGPRFTRAHQAHLLTANGVGIELFQFLDPPVEGSDDNFRYWRTGIFHICITDPDLDELVERIVANGGRQRTKIWAFLPDRPYRLIRGDVFEHAWLGIRLPVVTWFSPDDRWAAQHTEERRAGWDLSFYTACLRRHSYPRDASTRCRRLDARF